MRKNCKTFEQWVQSQVNEFHKISDKSDYLYLDMRATKYSHIFLGSLKCVIVNERRAKCGYSSVALNRYDDPTNIAIAVAWADYKGEEIPNFTKE